MEALLKEELMVKKLINFHHKGIQLSWCYSIEVHVQIYDYTWICTAFSSITILVKEIERLENVQHRAAINEQLWGIYYKERKKLINLPTLEEMRREDLVQQ